VMTAIRLGCTIAEAGHALFPNGERHLRSIEDLKRFYPPELLFETLNIADQCRFTLKDLNYEYPNEIVPREFDGDASAYLRHITYLGAAQRLSNGVTSAIRETLEKELALIKDKKYEAFFLTVYEIVKWSREQDSPILCQGRGSSANSAVCFCLGITAVNPEKDHLLFERFLSAERDEPPDIDVDFEHERREEVIQHIFEKYGRERAAIAATVISYRHKSAMRDVGRALGFDEAALDRLSAIASRVPSAHTRNEALRERDFDPDSRVIRQLVALVEEILGFPRHLSQHVGGFVISEKPLHHLVPVENAAMPERTIIQWDKDDLETMKLLKVDVLALGMLTALRKCLDLLHAHGQWTLPSTGARPALHDIPQDDDAQVYDMICRADTVGVFQIESRAQMSMLPRLLPRRFYDLVVEVAIVRPGPIQGQMVHPYLASRKNPQAVEYPQSRFERAANSQDSRVRDVLGRTLGVPIFQEQVMELLRVTADFTPGEADQLRRSMAAWRRRGGLEHFEQRIFTGMDKNGYDREFAQQIFEQIQGFGEYGFPESHATSFALLAWASSWLKHYHPAAFTCALLNSQPMGFYQPSQLIQDAQRHGVRVLPADVTISDWDCALESGALRLGLREIKGFAQSAAERIVATRVHAPFRNVADLTERARLNVGERALLANAGALRTLSGHRHRARWDSAGAELPLPVLAGSAAREAQVALRAPTLREDVMSDYATQGLSLTLHPLALIRPALARRRVVPARTTTHAENHGRHLRCAGLVTVRQHPGTAKGVTFVTLEDETGIVNVVVWQRLAEKQHRVLVESAVMAVDGKLEAVDGVHHLIANRLHDYSGLLPEFSFASRDFQ
jgi:error-prone DNA polymerase